MQKSARVTPRNIQFEDNVQIRHIPRDDEESNRRPSWDPNLQNHDVFKDQPKKQRKVVIGVAVAGGVLLVIVIGVIVGVIVGQKSSTTPDNSVSYNGICNAGSNQCSSSESLYCPNGFCACTLLLSWNTATGTCTFLTYNQACSTSSQCDSAAGLSCTGNCSCMDTKVWNISVCSCPTETFLNASGFCEPLYLYNSTCTAGSTVCDSTRGLYCNGSVCVCNATQFWDNNFDQCYPRLNYSEACSYDAACKPTMVCPTVPGVCNCPLYLPDYACNCLNTQFYNSVTSQCVSRATFGGLCTASLNYTCLTSLYCNAGTCACPLGTTWIAANSSCT